MREPNYEKYKADLVRADKVREGRKCILAGIGLLLFCLYFLPFGGEEDILGALFRPGYALCSLVVGASGIAWGVFLVIKNRNNEK